jgi:3-hydroxyisobutyrate dehydrogenase
VSLFQALADRSGIPLEISPILLEVFTDAARRFGPREWSPNVIRRLEEATGCRIEAPGFPAEMVDTEPKKPGCEVKPRAQMGRPNRKGATRRRYRFAYLSGADRTNADLRFF